MMCSWMKRLMCGLPQSINGSGGLLLRPTVAVNPALARGLVPVENVAGQLRQAQVLDQRQYPAQAMEQFFVVACVQDLPETKRRNGGPLTLGEGGRRLLVAGFFQVRGQSDNRRQAILIRCAWFEARFDQALAHRLKGGRQHHVEQGMAAAQLGARAAVIFKSFPPAQQRGADGGSFGKRIAHQVSPCGQTMAALRRRRFGASSGGFRPTACSSTSPKS